MPKECNITSVTIERIYWLLILGRYFLVIYINLKIWELCILAQLFGLEQDNDIQHLFKVYNKEVRTSEFGASRLQLLKSS